MPGYYEVMHMSNESMTYGIDLIESGTIYVLSLTVVTFLLHPTYVFI